jgi:futalosine hydrolase
MLLLIPTAQEAVLLLGEDAARPLWQGLPARAALQRHILDVALCGFGLAAAGAGAAHWFARLAEFRPSERPAAVLVGLAGSYDEERAPVGGVLIASAVACDGIGIGEGVAFQSAEEAGWRQGHPLADASPVGDRLELALPVLFSLGDHPRGEILSVAAASAGAVQAARRAKLFPAALAEDMETFAVALAARLAGVRLTVIRGLGNRAGDHDKTHWRTQEAMTAARDPLLRILEGEPR